MYVVKILQWSGSMGLREFVHYASKLYRTDCQHVAVGVCHKLSTVLPSHPECELAKPLARLDVDTPRPVHLPGGVPQKGVNKANKDFPKIF